MFQTLELQLREKQEEVIAASQQLRLIEERQTAQTVSLQSSVHVSTITYTVTICVFLGPTVFIFLHTQKSVTELAQARRYGEGLKQEKAALLSHFFALKSSLQSAVQAQRVGSPLKFALGLMIFNLFSLSER